MWSGMLETAKQAALTAMPHNLITLIGQAAIVLLSIARGRTGPEVV